MAPQIAQYELDRKNVLIELGEVQGKYKKYKRKAAKLLDEKKQMKSLIEEFEKTVEILKKQADPNEDLVKENADLNEEV